MERSAELLSTALTSELVRLKEQIGTMSEQFSQNFTGASDTLMRSVQGFQPTVEALSGAVGAAQRTVTEAVTRLNGHETVMQEMTGAATNIREAAEAFGAMRETLATSAARNEEAAKAQLAATQVNEAVAEQFGRVGEGLPELRQTLEDAARVIGSKPENRTLLDTGFVEGHTDSVPNSREMGNWGLSTYRAISLWNFWTDKPGELVALKLLRTLPADPKIPAKPLISVSG